MSAKLYLDTASGTGVYFFMLKRLIGAGLFLSLFLALVLPVHPVVKGHADNTAISDVDVCSKGGDALGSDNVSPALSEIPGTLPPAPLTGFAFLLEEILVFLSPSVSIDRPPQS